jgi:hypothetical protein
MLLKIKMEIIIDVIIRALAVVKGSRSVSDGSNIILNRLDKNQS